MFTDSDAYDRYMGRWSRRLARPFVEFAGVKAGDAVLDVGCGIGAVTVEAATIAGPGRVVGVDRSPAYVAAASSEAPREAGARFETGEAMSLSFDNASFDRTLSALVLTFVPDGARAAAEMRRVTRPGGVAAAAVWDYGSGMEMLRVFWDEAVAIDPRLEPRDERHLPLCREGQLTTLWMTVGFNQVVSSSIDIDMPFASFDDYWDPFLLGQGPAGACVSAMDEATRDKLAAALRKRLLHAGANAPPVLRGRAWVVRGTAPGPTA